MTLVESRPVARLVLPVPFDIDSAHSLISPVFGEFGKQMTMRQVLIDAFAHFTGDNNPLHLDPETAANGPFGRRVAHGLFLVALGTGSLRPPPTFDTAALPVLDGFRKITFKRPVYPDDLIACRERIAEVRRVRGGIMLTYAFSICKIVPAVKTAVAGYLDVRYL